jgi:UDP-3-O-[3-hydroxymyristoyl] glucosamine N-acyltransferase
MTLGELAVLVGGEVHGDPATRVTHVGGVEDAGPGSLVRVEHPKYLAAALAGPGAALLLGPEVGPAEKPALRVPTPRLAFILCTEALAPSSPLPPPGIHPTAVVIGDAAMGDGVSVGPGVIIGRGCRVGDRTALHAHVVLCEDVRVGADCVLHPHVTVYPRVEIGDRVRVHAGSVLGADGFSYVWDGQRHRKIPHRGTVQIEEDVEIGALSAVDRATTGATIVGAGTKIDNQVQVGHNVQIGRDCLIAGQAGLSGSVVLEPGVVIGGQVGIRDHTRIGEGAQLGGGAGVWNDLPAGGVYSGNPALPHRQAERMQIAFRRLPELLRRVRQLERQLAELTGGNAPRRHGDAE